MNTGFRVINIGVTLALAAFTASADDIGPTKPNGTVTSGGADEPAGLAVAIAGNSTALYVVTLNAGVWKAVNNGAWSQLPNSPPRAYSIAVDPNDSSHIAVGERGGDAVNVSLNGAGLWESYDAGNTWTRTLDPLLRPGGCNFQVIPAVIFDGNSTLFAATFCGVAVRQSGNANFTYPALPAGLGDSYITALAVSRNKIWARTTTRLIVSTDRGVTWSLIQAVPSGLGALLDANAGDKFSLAAFDSMAFIGAYKAWPTPPNNCAVLKYDVTTDTWSVQNPIPGTGSGVGLGGRKFMKSFDLNKPDLTDTLGQRLRLFCGVGQDVAQATGLNPDGSVQWSSFARTTESGASPRDPIHPDLWDLHVDSGYNRVWVTDDGGVHSKALASGGWATYDENLFTHHIHTLTVLPVGSSQNLARIAYPTSDNDAWYYKPGNPWTPLNALGDANYTAGDVGNPDIALMWRSPGWREGYGGQAFLTGFGSNLPNGSTLQRITLNPDETYDGPQFFQFIQTLNGESPTYPLLDAVMRVTLPLKYFVTSGSRAHATAVISGGAVTSINVTDGGSGYSVIPSVTIYGGDGVGATAAATLSGGRITGINVTAGGSGYTQIPGVAVDFPMALVPGTLGQPNPSGLQSLIRCTQFASNPDANSSRFQNWSLEVTDLPPGCTGFSVAGGHANPVYYAHTATRLFRYTPASGWLWLSNAGPLLDGSTYGPVFANPYDASQLYTLTSSGIRKSSDGGITFSTDTILTALLTASGKFPTNATFGGGNGDNLPRGIGSRALVMGTLSHMAFSRSNPKVVVAASPYTGVFFNDGDGNWKDLTSQLPRPYTPVFSLGIDEQSIYVATEGRGLLRILRPDTWVDFNWGGTEIGSFLQPFNTLVEGLDAVGNLGRTLIIKSGTTSDRRTINQAVTIKSYGGAVTIGR